MRKAKDLIADFKNLKKIWPYLKQWKKRIFLALSLVPIILIVHTSIPWVLGRTVDRGIMDGSKNAIIQWSLIYISLITLEYFLRGVQTLLLTISVHKMIRSLREALIRHVLELSPSYHDHNLSGALVTRATSDFDNMSESLNQGILSSIVDMAVILGTLVGLFMLNKNLSISVMLVLPFVALIVIVFSSTLKKTMLSARKKIARLNAFTQECLFGSTTIKTLTAESNATTEVHNMAIDYRNAQMKSVILDAFLFAILDGIASITIGLVLYTAASPYLNLTDESITPGILIAATAYIINLFEPLKQLSNKIAMLQGAFTAIDRIFGVLEVRDFIKGSKPISKISGDVSFKKVSFSYSKAGGNDKILDNLSFSIPAKSSLAIVGPTGSGKSTIIKLISKMYDGFDGEITLDQSHIQDLSYDSLIKQVGIVQQEITLFQGSIWFNVSLGLEGIKKKDVEAACKLVGAHEFILKMPGGYDFEVAEQGANLSQGQRQLISFARALAKNPSLIILDEATSSVDPKSEKYIQKAIQSIIKDRTVVIIAHRLTTIKNCDNILVLERGKITQQGDHATLMSSKGTYKTLVDHLV